MTKALSHQDVLFAMLAAALFGASTPAAKTLLPGSDPWLLAGALYLGSGLGLAILATAARLARTRLSRDDSLSLKDTPWIAGATLFGGIAGPVLLMLGLARTDAASASLLLNLEGVLTALLAWFVFRENFDRRIALGMALILIGGMVLSWSGGPHLTSLGGPLLIAGACLCWALDNNLTRKISGNNPVQLVMIKSLVAGGTNIALALAMGASLPAPAQLLSSGAVGFLGYGVSLLCFILALRHIGTARTGAYFSLAPFVGALISIGFLGDAITPALGIAAVFMGAGVWLHLTERHEHEHEHHEMEHSHKHTHDAHHQHEHCEEDERSAAQGAHAHPHRHTALRHAHAHFPDIHHRHEHEA